MRWEMRDGVGSRYVWYTARHRLARNCPPPVHSLSFLAAQTRASETTSPVVTNTKYAGEKCSAPLAAPAPFSRVAGLARTNHCPTQQTSRALFLRELQYFPGGAGGPLSRVFPCLPISPVVSSFDRRPPLRLFFFQPPLEGEMMMRIR